MSDSEDILPPEPDGERFDSQETTQFDRPPGPSCPPGKPPDRIGPYRLEGPLGHGGMGEVFLAWDELLERRVAIKRIRQGSPQTPDQRLRFRREAQAAARLSHSSIVQIHELIPDLSGDAIVMEYVEGMTLGDRITEGALPVREALRLAREIAEGLATAHAAGLIHRDLKPENVVITPQGQAKILDFGLVKPLNDGPQDPTITRQGVLLGTYQSMSPEQASCRPVDERSDLFSLGVLLYEMLSGRSPFRGTSALDTLKRVTTHQPPALSALSRTIPQGVSDLVDRLLAKSPDDRPPNARTVIQMLQDLEASQPLSSSDSVSEMATADLSKLARKGERQARPLTSTGGMSVKRRRWHAVAAGVVIILALATVALIGRAKAPGKGQTRSPEPVVQADDYNSFRQIQQRVDSGEAVVLGPELDRLEGIIQRSPRFPDAQVLAARLALKLFQSTRESSYLNRASSLVKQAKSLTPDGPQLLTVEFQVVLEEDQKRAEAVLEKMKQVLGPNDPAYLVQRSFWFDRQGKWKEALSALRKAVALEKSSSWQDLITLAQIENRHGLAVDARAHLKEVLERYPRNFWANEILGEVELYYGDLVLAERIFRELARLTPRRNPRTNLGQALAVQGKYQDAIEAYQSALSLEPYHPAALLGLAEAESELGLTNDASDNFQKALDNTREGEKSAALSNLDIMLKAQCMARLGNTEKAVRLAGEALRRSPGEPLVQLQAAMVYSLTGDTNNALANARAAIDQGIQKRWFKGSAFHHLAKDPRFQELVL